MVPVVVQVHRMSSSSGVAHGDGVARTQSHTPTIPPMILCQIGRKDKRIKNKNMMHTGWAKKREQATKLNNSAVLLSATEIRSVIIDAEMFKSLYVRH